MSLQPRCSPESAWTGLYLGDCAQHLNRADSAYVDKAFVTYRGAKYSSLPRIIFYGGGPNAEGAIGTPLMSDGQSGFVTGVKIVQGGWHYIANPTFLASGDFALDGEHKNCPNWDDKTCAASGYATIAGGRQFFVNSTVVHLNPDAHPKPEFSVPYIRRNAADCQDSPDCSTGNVYECGPWDANRMVRCAAPSFYEYDAGSPYFWNCYQATTGVKDYALCRKIGFKNAQAKKSFHGSIGFSLAGDDNCNGGATGDSLSVITTKYLTRTVAITYSLTQNWTYKDSLYDLAGTNTANGNLNTSATIDRYKGTYTVDSCSEDYSLNPVPFGFVSPAVPIPLGQLEILAGMGSDCGNITIPAEFTFFPALTPPLTPSSLVSQLEAQSYSYDADNYQTVTASCSLSRTALSLSITTVKHERNLDIYGYGQTSQLTSTLTVNISFSNPYTAADCVSDLFALLDYIPLNDDVIYPWRTDGYLSTAPLVTYSEIPQGIEPPRIASCRPIVRDSNAGAVNGSVIGQMLPGGYDTFFDFSHITHYYFTSVGGSRTACIYGYGAWAGPAPGIGVLSQDPTDSVVPPNTTQWTDQIDATLYPPGAWIYYDATSKVFTAQKWAEVIVGRPAYNFARPCGADRYTCVENTYACILSFNAAAKTIEINNAASPDGTDTIIQAIDTSQPVRVCGTNSALDGVWRASTTDNINYTLNTLVCPGSQITGTFDYDFCNSPNGRIGQIRWPSAPAICSTVNITGCYSGDVAPYPHLYLLLDRDTYLHSGDIVTVTGVSGISGINGHNWNVIYHSPSKIELSGASLSGSYITGGWIASVPSGTDPYWDDTRPKGNFIYANWSFNFRDIAINTGLRLAQTGCGIIQAVNNMTVIQDCLPFSVCSPQVVCISPNADDTFTNGKRYSLPAINNDESFGSWWQGRIFQVMQDPLWNTPAKPCITDLSINRKYQYAWQSDDGTCQYGGTDPDAGTPFRHYAFPPMFEAITGYPSGAPVLPSDANTPIIVATGLNMVGSPCPSNVRVYVVPGAMGASIYPNVPNIGVIDTYIYSNQKTCVCDGGFFAASYLANGVYCSGNQIAAAP